MIRAHKIRLNPTPNQEAYFKKAAGDFIHKMTTTIAQTYGLEGVEDLYVKGMQKHRRLALSIVDASWGEILRQLASKSAWYGGQVVKVGRFFASSKTYCVCGHVHRDLQLSDRHWACQGCGSVHNRDWNASKNIEREVLRLVSG